MSKYAIAGIQQVGIGNRSVYAMWEWYRKHLGMNIPVFDEQATAKLMLPYTGGQPRDRHAVLAMNIQGGGGAEIWQYVGRDPLPNNNALILGDLGINRIKFKVKEISDRVKSELSDVDEIVKDILGRRTLDTRDNEGNSVQLVERSDFFSDQGFYAGGICGVTIGVSDMDRSITFYKDLLHHRKMLIDQEGEFEDLPSGRHRRVILSCEGHNRGPFSGLLGYSEIELIQNLDRTPKKIFEGRLWGDLGYIHLCFDVVGMSDLREYCKQVGHPFTVDSGDFDMGEAAGQFAYIEDPDGTLIEFVETQKVPIMKKLGWYLDLRKRRDRYKRLPDWMLKAMRFSAKKNEVYPKR